MNSPSSNYSIADLPLETDGWRRSRRKLSGEKGLGSAAAAATEITLLDPSVTDANSRAFSSITKPLQIPNGSPVSAIGSAPTSGLLQSVPGFDLMLGYNTNSPNSIYPSIPSESSAIPSTLQVSLQVPSVPAAPTLLGKRAKQRRDGDWM
ncbi:unnamed protein product [Fraxinus pennsylvanica]|uniref:Uncharacterized protein n=1 Tax=Fraxinus pennsylvanica TaxID=56036 RepID=A0AAD1YMS3_9LAMI|nr:unnamed protein product [Fraxinus pennsylvanica]